MKIGIFSDAILNRHNGIGNYTYQVIRGLQKISDIHEIVLINDKEIKNCNLAQHIIPNPFPVYRTYSWYIYAMHKLNKEQFDIIHNPSQVATFIQPKNSYVITIHDLSPKLFPSDHVLSTRLNCTWLLPRTCRTATKVIADSMSTKNDLVRYFNVEPNGITVIYPAADPQFRKLSEREIANWRESVNIPDCFILSVGNLSPRKNITSLLIAYHKLLCQGFQHRLVIVGKTWRKNDKTFNLVERLSLKGKVIFIEGLSIPQLCLLYNKAELFVYPSLFEGFGLPPLEAMTCGCPVITSNVTSLPEVVGEAGICIDPYDGERLADQMKTVLSDENLKKEMRLKGIQRAKLFSWDIFIRKTFEVYRDAAET